SGENGLVTNPFFPGTGVPYGKLLFPLLLTTVRRVVLVLVSLGGEWTDCSELSAIFCFGARTGLGRLAPSSKAWRTRLKKFSSGPARNGAGANDNIKIDNAITRMASRINRASQC